MHRRGIGQCSRVTRNSNDPRCGFGSGPRTAPNVLLPPQWGRSVSCHVRGSLPPLGFPVLSLPQVSPPLCPRPCHSSRLKCLPPSHHGIFLTRQEAWGTGQSPLASHSDLTPADVFPQLLPPCLSLGETRRRPSTSLCGPPRRAPLLPRRRPLFRGRPAARWVGLPSSTGSVALIQGLRVF